MIDASVLIPVRNASDAIAEQLPRLTSALDQLRKTFEIIVIDDDSSPAEVEKLATLLSKHPWLRVLRLDKSHGAATAISAGLVEARGRELLAMPAGAMYSTVEIARLFKGLSRADLVHARPQVQGLVKTWQRIRRIPRWLFLGLQIREPACSFWSARSEALAGIHLARGMYRYLPTLVAMRGFRVAEVPVRRLRHPHQLRDAWPNPGDLLCAWWLRRRWRNYVVEELAASNSGTVEIHSLGDGSPRGPSSENHSGTPRRLSA
jgi:dolichol-phosphate mannosyltransferase